jgi:hypothetical protein
VTEYFYRYIKQGESVQYPLSPDEHAAMARYLAGIRKQLQDISDLFSQRYGRDSSIAEIAVKTLVSATLLDHELSLLVETTADSATKVESELRSLGSRHFSGN